MTRSTALKTSSTKRSKKPQVVVGSPASDAASTPASAKPTTPRISPRSNPCEAVQPSSAPPEGEPSRHGDLLAARRQWILSVQWVLLLVAIVALPMIAPWWTCAAILPPLLVTWWLYSLNLAGLRPPETLVRLDIARLVGHAFDSARGMAIRALGGESKGKGQCR